MVKRFLNYVDVTTQFGLIHISGNSLFEMFARYKKLSPQQSLALRAQLKNCGVL